MFELDYKEVLNQNHVLVAGITGSGKSVIINGIIYNGLSQSPEDFSMILCDPKKVELSRYKNLPHCIRYASEPEDMVQAVEYAMYLTESRFNAMELCNITEWNGGDIWLIIDEWADLMTTCGKQVAKTLRRLCQIGRAAHVHVLAATQYVLAKILPTDITYNFGCVIGLRTRNAQASRLIIQEKGCESLPEYGHCLYCTAKGTEEMTVHMYEKEQIKEMVDYWTFRTIREQAEPEKKSLFGRIKNLFR